MPANSGSIELNDRAPTCFYSRLAVDRFSLRLAKCSGPGYESQLPITAGVFVRTNLNCRHAIRRRQGSALPPSLRERLQDRPATAYASSRLRHHHALFLTKLSTICCAGLRNYAVLPGVYSNHLQLHSQPMSRLLLFRRDHVPRVGVDDPPRHPRSRSIRQASKPRMRSEPTPGWLRWNATGDLVHGHGRSAKIRIPVVFEAHVRELPWSQNVRNREIGLRIIVSQVVQEQTLEHFSSSMLALSSW